MNEFDTMNVLKSVLVGTFFLKDSSFDLQGGGRWETLISNGHNRARNRLIGILRTVLDPGFRVLKLDIYRDSMNILPIIPRRFDTENGLKVDCNFDFKWPSFS